MRWNKQILSIDCIPKYVKIYDVDKANELYDLKKYKYHSLSMMKQENIRMALKDTSFKLQEIKEAAVMFCGYCFEFREINCTNCELFNLENNDFGACYNSEWHEKMRKARTKKLFAKYHKSWCEELGIWNKNWE